MKDWTLGIVLGSVGIVIISLAATGILTTPIELTLWTIAGIGWVVVAHRFAARPWLAVVVAGVASGLFAGAMQAALLGPLVANHAAWSEYTVDPATRAQAFATALPIGIVWGLLFGGIAWLVKRITARREPALAA